LERYYTHSSLFCLGHGVQYLMPIIRVWYKDAHILTKIYAAKNNAQTLKHDNCVIRRTHWYLLLHIKSLVVPYPSMQMSQWPEPFTIQLLQ